MTVFAGEDVGHVGFVADLYVFPVATVRKDVIDVPLNGSRDADIEQE